MPDDDGNNNRALSFHWDVNTALATIVLGSLAFLWIVARGFRGFNVNLNG